MSFGIVTRNQNQILYREGLIEGFLTDYTEHPPEFSRYLKVGSVSVPEISRTRAAGPARLYRSDDGEPPTFETIDVGPKVSAVDREFSSGYGVTRKALEDEWKGYNLLNQGAKHLGHAGRMTQEYQSAALLNDSFTGSTFLGMDGLALYSTAHTLLRSPSTVSNRAATPVGFSIGGLSALFDLAGKCKDENNDPIVIMPNLCIIPNEEGIKQDAKRIFEQNEEPFTANRNDNPIKNNHGSINWFASHFQSSASNYHLIDTKWNDSHFLNRVAMQMWDWKDDPTGTQFVAARTRFMIYFFNWRGWYGANPT